MRRVVKRISIVFFIVLLLISGTLAFGFYKTNPRTLIAGYMDDSMPIWFQWLATQSFYTFHPRDSAVERLNDEAGARYAALYRKPEQARAMLGHLLENGVNIDSVDDQEGRTALHFAVDVGSPRAVRLLLNKGADPSAEGAIGKIPLELAKDWADQSDSGKNYEVIIQLLTEAQHSGG